jgi:hypothetical protein
MFLSKGLRFMAGDFMASAFLVAPLWPAIFWGVPKFVSRHLATPAKSGHLATYTFRYNVILYISAVGLEFRSIWNLPADSKST